MRPGRLLLGSGPLVAALIALVACGESDVQVVAPPPDASPAVVPGLLGSALPIDEARDIPGMDQPVDVVRDSFGTVHIYARTAEDAFRAQGFMVAQDRGLQLELLRRIAQGRMAEIAAKRDPSWIDADIVMRTVGLHRTAKVSYDALPAQGEVRRWLDAFASGIEASFARVRSGADPIPEGGKGASRDWFTTWSGADSLAILELRAFGSSLRIDEDRDLTALLDWTLATFNQDSSDPALKRRARIAPDLLRFAPATSATLTSPLSSGSPTAGPRSDWPWHVDPDLLAAHDGTFAALRSLRGRFSERGSTAWAVGPARSMSGNALLASSPQFPLVSDGAFWFVHLEVEPEDGASASRLRLSGASIPGVPGVWIGNNETLAWAPGNSGVDESDLYFEKLSEDGTAVSFLGSAVPLQTVTETIAVEGAEAIAYGVSVVPHHGPMLPRIAAHAIVPADPAMGALSFRWTGLEPGHAIEGLLGLPRARTTADARAAISSWRSGANLFTFADSQGAIEVDLQPAVPTRERGAFEWDSSQQAGLLPCLVLPGAGGAEWNGTMKAEHVPSVRSPARAWVVAAEADLAGTSLDNDPSNEILADGTPVFFSCSSDLGFRHDRIASMLESLGLHGVEGFGAMQSDVRSPLGARLADHLADVLTRAEEEKKKPGTWPSLSAVVASDRFAAAGTATVIETLARWSELGMAAGAGVRLSDGTPSMGGEDADASKAALLFNAWLVRLMQVTVRDETQRMGYPRGLPPDLGFRVLLNLIETEPSMLASYDAEMRDSILWDDLDTPELESRDDRMVVALLDVLEWLDGAIGTQREDWRWGLLHTARLHSLVEGIGIGAIPDLADEKFPRGYPRHGDLHVVDETGYEFTPLELKDLSFEGSRGAALRFVVEMAPSGPRARLALAGVQAPGAAAQTALENEVEYWRNNQQHEVPWGREGVVAAAIRRTVLAPVK